MRHPLFRILSSVALTAMMLIPSLFMSCVDEELPCKNTPKGNFEVLWQLMDERYCFFEYKKEELGVDWNEVHDKYSRRLSSFMTNEQLFEVLSGMLGELKDGHVNLISSFNYGRNWSYWEDFPENYNDSIARSYLGKDYYIASGLSYKILDNNVGYVRIESFSVGFSEGNISSMLQILSGCRGLIIDVRGNGGGSLSNSNMLVRHFTDEKRLMGYAYHKTGKGHNDFSKPEAVYVEPSNGIRWHKGVVVITNRKCFSATNDFVKCMHTLPNVTVLGDRTGGGSGMPFNQELPNGWGVRYSAVVYLDPDGQHTEFGIAPDTLVLMKQSDILRHKDTLIEAAMNLF